MKNLILIRHAKSSWKNLTLDDFDRPLNKRGKRDAPLMGKKLQERHIIPDLILSSPAKRAEKTVKIISRAVDYPEKNIVFKKKMYHSSALYLFKMVKKLKNDKNIVACIGHNPGFNDLANMLLRADHIKNIPTSGIYSIGFHIDRWEEIQPEIGETLFFDYPKKYRNNSV